MSDKNSRETDLAYIIHGVVIATGFTYIPSVKSKPYLISLLSLLAISILDWHLFYKMDDFLEKKKGSGYYTADLWIIDYVILACYAICFKTISNNSITSFLLSITTHFKIIFFFSIGIGVLSSIWWIIIHVRFLCRIRCLSVILGLIFYSLIPFVVYFMTKANFVIGTTLLLLDFLIYPSLIQYVKLLYEKSDSKGEKKNVN